MRMCNVMCRWKIANEALKKSFQQIHPKIISSVSPDSIMDVLFSKKLLTEDDYYRLREVSVARDRCRDMMSLLHSSSHPQMFIHLRLALLEEYSFIVAKIDDQIPSLDSQLQQLHLNCSDIGKILWI